MFCLLQESFAGRTELKKEKKKKCVETPSRAKKCVDIDIHHRRKKARTMTAAPTKAARKTAPTPVKPEVDEGTGTDSDSEDPYTPGAATMLHVVYVRKNIRDLLKTLEDEIDKGVGLCSSEERVEFSNAIDELELDLEAALSKFCDVSTKPCFEQ